MVLIYSFPNLFFSHCSTSVSNCFFLTCTQIFQDVDKVAWYFHLCKNFPFFFFFLFVIHIVKGFGIVSETEIDIFLEFSFFFYDPTDVGNLISDSSAFSKTALNIWKFTFHVLLKKKDQKVRNTHLALPPLHCTQPSKAQ